LYVFRYEEFDESCGHEDNVYAEDDDEYVPVEMELSSTSTNSKKWIGCANHNLQLALKVLDKDQKFSKSVKHIVELLRKIRSTPTALNEFRNKSSKTSIVLPVATR
jgi:hypothetical protein